jgi:hypothetical protein
MKSFIVVAVFSVVVATSLLLIVNKDNPSFLLGMPTGNPSVSPTLPVPQSGDLPREVCDPANGPFSATITNPYFPLPVGMVHFLEDESTKLKVSSLNKIEMVAGVPTRVVEEREWEDGELIEVSRNFFTQAPDGTVCYYGEDVDIYKNGVITKHSGSWRAGVDENKPGIQMPANPVVGQKYQQEIAPKVAMDRAMHAAIEPSFKTPAGTFKDVLYVVEDPKSDKRYAKGIGWIYDNGISLTKY